MIEFFNKSPNLNQEDDLEKCGFFTDRLTSVHDAKKIFEKGKTRGRDCLPRCNSAALLRYKMTMVSTYFAKRVAVAAGIQHVANILSRSAEDVTNIGW